tara:strand:+ start:717 stop:1010 length:294 start_codon:yes stop_codon:yes gene_type:complete
MKNLNDILGRYRSEVLNENKTSPLTAKQKKRQLILKAAKKYFTYDKYIMFMKLYLSPRINDNKMVYDTAHMLYDKYRKEQSEWLQRKEQRRTRSKMY